MTELIITPNGFGVKATILFPNKNLDKYKLVISTLNGKIVREVYDFTDLKRIKMKKREFLKLGLLSFSAMTLSNKLGALEYYPNKSDKRWAILYGTWCGSSRDAAVWISEGMDGIANVFDVREDPDLSGYDHIVVGGSIRGGQVRDLLQEYLEKNREKISDKIRGLFAVCGNMMQPVGPEQTTAFIDNHIAKLCGVSKKVPSKVFLGRITYGLLDEESREVIQGFNMPEYDNLKREECMAYGKEILSFVKQQ